VKTIVLCHTHLRGGKRTCEVENAGSMCLSIAQVVNNIRKEPLNFIQGFPSHTADWVMEAPSTVPGTADLVLREVVDGKRSIRAALEDKSLAVLPCADMMAIVLAARGSYTARRDRGFILELDSTELTLAVKAGYDVSNTVGKVVAQVSAPPPIRRALIMTLLRLFSFADLFGAPSASHSLEYHPQYSHNTDHLPRLSLARLSLGAHPQTSLQDCAFHPGFGSIGCGPRR
jgi:hypothetical protein